MIGSDMVVGGLYKFGGQKEVLKYIGKNFSGNGYWHQFEKVGVQGVWCEMLDSDLHLIEEQKIMSKIKTITASNCGEEKSEVYRLLNMIHAMASVQAVAKTGGWKLKSCCTDSGYAETTWTNNTVDVKAVTIGGDNHRYTMSAVEDSEQ